MPITTKDVTDAIQSLVLDKAVAKERDNIFKVDESGFTPSTFNVTTLDNELFQVTIVRQKR